MIQLCQTAYQKEHINKFMALYKEAISNVSDLQTWPGYFLTKKTETEIVFDSNVFKKGSIGLEIGCGNAFQSALLSSVSNRIFATDLFRENGATHSLGIKKAQDLISTLNIKNITLISCSAISLPFDDDYFDFIFSSSALEHVADKKAALKEMRRVLKPDGNMVLIVPTHMPSLYAFPHLFLYIIARLFKVMLNSKTAQKENYNNDAGFNMQNKEISLWKRFFKNHPSFPLPEPHGEYKNIFDELKSQFPGVWLNMVRGEGFRITKTMPLCLFPWLLIEPFSTRLASRFYSLSKWLNISVSNIKILQYMGYLIAIFAKKRITYDNI